jgi:hypothetical protein
VQQRKVQRAVDAVHALLPLVPDEGQAGVETAVEQGALPVMSLGRGHDFLGSLSMVQ